MLVIGGSDAGISAGFCAKEFSPDTEVTMILADRYPNFSICGLPFYLSGEVSDWNILAQPTCLALAMHVWTGEAAVRLCLPVFEEDAKFSHLREPLLDICAGIFRRLPCLIRRS